MMTFRILWPFLYSTTLSNKATTINFVQLFYWAPMIWTAYTKIDMTMEQRHMMLKMVCSSTLTEEMLTQMTADDIKIVMRETNATYSQAFEALIRNNGDIVNAIMQLQY